MASIFHFLLPKRGETALGKKEAWLPVLCSETRARALYNGNVKNEETKELGEARRYFFLGAIDSYRRDFI